ncbi:MAG: DNA integrity scanning diadenylate cyclase DisA [Coriobacteriia bacterium]
MDTGRDDILEQALGMIAPGTELREAIDSIRLARTGALLVIGDTENVLPLCDGGFVIDAPFEAERVFELSKMDGAIILGDEGKQILRANVHLVPDSSLPTSETGIRHRTAERVSRQTDALVIAVSKRRVSVTIYRAGQKLILEELETVLAKANQALQTLQRYRVGFDEASAHLTALEFDDVVTLDQVVAVVQKCVAAMRVGAELQRYVKQLGIEGRLVRMQSDELMLNIEQDLTMLLRDYAAEAVGPRKVASIRNKILELSQEQLLDGTAVAQILGYQGTADVLETRLAPRGYRVLSKIPLLPATVVNRLVDKYGDLRALMAAGPEDLDEVDGVGSRRAQAIKDGLRRMSEQRGH